MADAEFTHEEDRGSFETLVLRAGLDDPALTAIGELIHELDIADGKFDRPEAPGLGAMLNGLCASSEDDRERIARGSAALDPFHAYLSHRKPPRCPTPYRSHPASNRPPTRQTPASRSPSRRRGGGEARTTPWAAA